MIGGCIVCRRLENKKNKTAKARRQYWGPTQVARRAAAQAARAAEGAARKQAKATAKAAAAELRRLRTAAKTPAEKERERYRKNREAILARSALYRAANREKLKASALKWRQANRAKIRANKRQRKIRKRATIVSELTKLQRGRCAYCREKLVPDGIQIDHIEPMARGGPNSRRNYQLACPSCNNAKSAKDPIMYAQEIGRLL